MSAEPHTTSDVGSSPEAAPNPQLVDPSQNRPVERVVPELHRSSGSFELVLSGVAFGLVGWLVDRWLDTTPVFLVVFTIVGLVGAVLSIYYRYRYQITKLQDEAAELREAARRAQASRGAAR